MVMEDVEKTHPAVCQPGADVPLRRGAKGPLEGEEVGLTETWGGRIKKKSNRTKTAPWGHPSRRRAYETQPQKLCRRRRPNFTHSIT